MGPEPKYRYPGINFFTKEDQDVFCGRADDAHKLFNRVMLNNTMVLHGESGTGKSSLVQAGLIPLLEKRNEYLLSLHKPQYLPVTIRLDSILEISNKEKSKTAGESDILVRQMLKAIDVHRDYKAKELPYITRKDDSFWYTAKLFEKNNYTLLLILDQFEELQGYSYKEAEVFAQKLSELFVSTMPEAIYKEYDKVTADLVNEKEMTDDARKEYNQCVKFLEQPLNVRILFVVREDKLGTMSLMSDYFPDILKNDFFLLPLDENGARRAIAEPALKAGNFKSESFSFDKLAIEYLLLSLVDQNTKLYDPIQLQIVCSSIERKIAPDKKLIKKEDIPEIKDIISEFYKDTWKGIKTELKLSDKQYEIKRKAIIGELVVSGKRNLVLKNLLISDGNEQDENIIKSLVREGMLRKIPSGKDTFYQLSHDRLIAPLTEDLKNLNVEENVQKEIQKQKSKARKIRNRLLLAAMVLFATTSFIAFYFYLQARKEKRIAEQEKYLLISRSLSRADNPTLSYVIASDWLKKHSNADTMKNYLAAFDTSNYVYLEGIYPALSEVISANISGESSLTVTEKLYQSVWDLKKGIMTGRTKISTVDADKRIRTSRGLINVILRSDSVTLKDEKGGLIARGSVDEDYNPDDLTISDDGRHMLVMNSLYEIIDQAIKKISSAEYPRLFTNEGNLQDKVYQPTASLFLNNNSIAVGYENGNIRLYEIDTNNKIKINYTVTLESQNVSYFGNNEIIKIAIDSKRQYLFAANSQNGIDVWDLSLLKSGKAENDNDFRRENLPITELKGHTGPVKCLSFSSDDKMLLSGSSDYTAILWDISTKDIKRITILKGPNASEIRLAGFFNNDKDIITVSGNDDKNNIDKVYVWKKERPSALYTKNQLYRFSPFNYAMWGLKKDKDVIHPDTTISAQYSAVLNYLLTIPLENEYPTDKGYNQVRKSAFADIEGWYNKLANKKNYHSSFKDYSKRLLEKCYDVFSLNGLDESVIPQQSKMPPGVGGQILKAKRDLIEWRIFLADTSNRSKAPNIASISLITNSYFVRKGDYADGLRFIRFYNDSIWQPLNTKYGESSFLQGMKKIINLQWLKYYLYMEKPGEAIKLANELSRIKSSTIDNGIYLVAAYLVSDRYDDAATLYSDTTKIKRKINNSRILGSLLSRLKKKNIAVPNIDRFNKEFNSKSAGNDD